MATTNTQVHPVEITFAGYAVSTLREAARRIAGLFMLARGLLRLSRRHSARVNIEGAFDIANASSLLRWGKLSVELLSEDSGRSTKVHLRPVAARNFSFAVGSGDVAWHGTGRA